MESFQAQTSNLMCIKRRTVCMKNNVYVRNYVRSMGKNLWTLNEAWFLFISLSFSLPFFRCDLIQIFIAKSNGTSCLIPWWCIMCPPRCTSASNLLFIYCITHAGGGASGRFSVFELHLHKRAVCLSRWHVTPSLTRWVELCVVPMLWLHANAVPIQCKKTRWTVASAK